MSDTEGEYDLISDDNFSDDDFPSGQCFNPMQAIDDSNNLNAFKDFICNKIKIYDKCFSKLRRQIRKLAKENSELRRENSVLNNTNSELSQQLEVFNTAMSKQQQDAENRMEELKLKMTALQIENEILKRSNEETNQRKQDEIERLKNFNEELASKYKNCDEQLKKLNKQGLAKDIQWICAKHFKTNNKIGAVLIVTSL